jgi:hypothetical protein
MSLQDLDILARYGIKIKTVADKMGVSESLLRYHLMSELRHPATCTKFRDALLAIANGVQTDLADHVKAVKPKKPRRT